MRNCCILGGGGFIGTNLARYLLDRGIAVTLFGRTIRFPESVAAAVCIRDDFSATDAVCQAIQGCDTVFHLVGATNPATSQNDKIADLRNNVENSIRFFEALPINPACRIVFLSSGGAIYGPQAKPPISEESPQWPICSYGITKLAIERYLHLYATIKLFDYRIVRLSNPYGPYQLSNKGQGVVDALLHRALLSEKCTIIGDGKAIRDYFFIDDAVEALYRIAEYSGEERVFNIGSGVGTSLIELIGIIEQVLGHKMQCEHAPDRGFDVPVNVLNIDRAINCLHWRPKTTLREGIQKTFQWKKAMMGK